MELDPKTGPEEPAVPAGLKENPLKVVVDEGGVLENPPNVGAVVALAAGLVLKLKSGADDCDVAAGLAAGLVEEPKEKPTLEVNPLGDVLDAPKLRPPDAFGDVEGWPEPKDVAFAGVDDADPPKANPSKGLGAPDLLLSLWGCSFCLLADSSDTAVST